MSYSKQPLSRGTKAAQTRANPFPLCQVPSHLQPNGMENIWSWTRQNKTRPNKTRPNKTRQHPFPSLKVTKLVDIYQKAKRGSVKNKVIWGLKLLSHPGWMPLVHGSEDFIQNNRQTHRRLNPPHYDAHFFLPSILLFIRIILYCLLRKQLRNYM